MNEDVEKIVKRLQRKIEIVRDDQKRSVVLTYITVVKCLRYLIC